ncbi:OLC1v1005227C1 [Oldenlandia corymbosa var. corymbosa]|uniref:OLC1v1005227C1 n=1 Tax=Oldenlandia corymbosa var. corymbosa TaxID=529605 RepID=A0AAV1DE68_OLDCO|nr:OLC1v1005227C1 [Oldenlandia corymbosa var. corymbosa]
MGSSLLMLPKIQLQYTTPRWYRNAHYGPLSLTTSLSHLVVTNSVLSTTLSTHRKLFCGITASVISDSKMPTTFTADSAGGVVDVLPDTGGGGDDFGNSNGGDDGGGGGSGGNDGGNGNNKNEGEGKDDDAGSSKKNVGMSMSQKLTLGYALLVGAGGVMGCLKSGSHKSLLAGGLSASLLYYVYTTLPTNPVFASSLGLGLSAALLVVMGSRFRRSGKIFPAGVVSFVSFVMSAGYLHGVLRSVH